MLSYSANNRAIGAAPGGGEFFRCLWVWLALVGIAGPLLLLAVDVVAVLTVPQYDPVRDVMSNLAWTDLGWAQSLGLYISALMLGALAWGFLRVVRVGLRWRSGAGLFFLAAVCFILVGTFHNNHGFAPVTAAHLTHTISAVVATAAFPATALLLAGEFRRRKLWSWLYLYTITAAGAGLALSLVAGVSLLPGVDDWPWFGLGERIIFSNGVVWCIVMIFWLWRLAGCDAPAAVPVKSRC